MKYFLFLFFAIQTPFLNAQVASFSIKANVVDTQGAAIDFFNSVILNPADSSFYFGNTFTDGILEIQGIQQEKVLLKITAVGYQPHFQLVEHQLDNSIENLGAIKLLINQLQSVTVTARNNVIEHRGSDMIFNVEKSALKESGTAMDVLQNTPKVFLDRNGGLSIIGKGTALIYVNGQQISSTQILSSISSTGIKQIEIIENPSAKYDASGNAVINIITKSKVEETRKISLLNRVEQGKFFRSYYKLDTYLKFDKLLFQANYGIRPWAWGGRNRQTRTNNVDHTFGKLDNYFVQKNQRLDHDYTISSTYFLSPKSKLLFNYIGTNVGGKKRATSTRTAEVTDRPVFTIDGTIAGPYRQISNTSNLSFSKDLDTLGSNLRATAQYSNFNFERNEENDQVLRQDYLLGLLTRKSLNLNNIGIYTFQIDYSKVFKNNVKFESGLKNVLVQNKSSVDFENKNNDGTYSPLEEFSNGFSYNEQILAGYAQSEFQFKKTTFLLGLRSEWTKMNGSSTNTENANKIDRTYLNFFPNVSVNSKLSEKTSLVFDYSYRINRPIFQDLNPYILYVDSLVSLRGNPNLLPEYAHSLAANYFLGEFNLGFNYSHTKNKINQVYRSLEPNNPDAISFVKENLRFANLYSLSISRSFLKGKYSGYATLSGFYDDHQIDDISALLSNNKFGYYVQMNHSMIFPANIKFDVYLNYTSSRVDGVYTDNPISYINLSLAKSFINNKLRLTLWGNDVFNKFRYTGESSFNNMYMTYLSEGDYHLIRLSLNWNFGKLSTSQFKRKDVSSEELNRINANQ